MKIFFKQTWFFMQGLLKQKSLKVLFLNENIERKKKIGFEQNKKRSLILDMIIKDRG